MRGLTVRQPWAWLIERGHKRYENRTWPTRYRGPLLIHAGTSLADYQVARAAAAAFGVAVPDELSLALGSVVAIIDLVGCVYNDEHITEREPFRAAAGFSFTLSNPRPLAKPVKWRGNLGLWNVPEALQNMLEVVDPTTGEVKSWRSQ